MGLFSKHNEVDNRPVAANTTEPRRSSRLFGSSSSTSTTPANSRNSLSNSPTRRSGGGLFHKHEDPSIIAARERVARAEVAEKQADRALLEAKAMSRSAREQTKMLEREAAEEARLAKNKQHAARGISKRGKLLGRHDHVTV